MAGLPERDAFISRRAVIGAGGAGLLAGLVPGIGMAASPGADPVAAALQPLLQAGRLAGASWEVRRRGRIIASGAAGFLDIANRVPLAEDSIFQIMSTSKVVIAIAAQMLAEEGALDLAAPVADYLPEFGAQWLVRSDQDGERMLVRPSRPSTIADLLSHSSGLPDAPPIVGRFEAKLHYSLAEMSGIMSQQPLVYEPGARFLYSNVGIAVAAHVVEMVSGLAYDEFVRRRIFAPLGLTRMGFHVTAAEEVRVPLAYKLEEGLQPLRDRGPGDGDFRFRRRARYILPEAGIYATAHELASLFQAVLDDARHGARRLLSPEALAEMVRPRVPVPDKDGVIRTWQGLGWRIAATDGGSLDNAMGRAGSYGHSGALGSTAWIDPAGEIVAILMIQTLPAAEARRAFARGVANLGQ